MKKVYFVQPGNCIGNNVYLPYSVGSIAAYAWSNESIKETYELADLLFLFEDIDKQIQSMDSPFLVGFSCYIWNYEYILRFAEKLKKAYPECYILFGGHNVNSYNAKQLEEFPFVDFLIHDEGEIPFRDLLLALKNGTDFSKITNFSYRDQNGNICKNESVIYDVDDLPSPYSMGIFDKIMKNYDYNFSVILETNRGCPYGCSYCDWGIYKSKIRCFPLERVYSDLQWFSDNKIDYCLCSDANFGIIKRDMEIAEKLIEIRNKSGFPNKVNFCTAKSGENFVYEISKKLNDAGVLKSASLSIQTLNPDALKNIGRTNFTKEKFQEMDQMYRKVGVSTLAELILGLPGETLKSFCENICLFFEVGHHIPISVYNCQLLMNSKMSQPDYIKRHGIKSVKMPLSFHTNKEEQDKYPEYIDIVIETNTLSKEDWVSANLFYFLTYAFHGMGLMQFFAQYIHYELNVSYYDFYSKLYEYVFENKNTVAFSVFNKIRNIHLELLQGKGSYGCELDWAGDVIWPFTEFAYLSIAHDKDLFYEEMKPFLKQFNIKDDIFEELFLYQKSMVKYPGLKGFEINLKKDWHTYFCHIFDNVYIPLPELENVLTVSCPNTPDDWKTFSRDMVWYGRRERRMLCVNQAVVKYIY